MAVVASLLASSSPNLQLLAVKVTANTKRQKPVLFKGAAHYAIAPTGRRAGAMRSVRAAWTVVRVSRDVAVFCTWRRGRARACAVPVDGAVGECCGCRGMAWRGGLFACLVLGPLAVGLNGVLVKSCLVSRQTLLCLVSRQTLLLACSR